MSRFLVRWVPGRGDVACARETTDLTVIGQFGKIGTPISKGDEHLFVFLCVGFGLTIGNRIGISARALL